VKLRLLFPLREALSSTTLIERARELADNGFIPARLHIIEGINHTKQF